MTRPDLPLPDPNFTLPRPTTPEEQSAAVWAQIQRESRETLANTNDDEEHNMDEINASDWMRETLRDQRDRNAERSAPAAQTTDEHVSFDGGARPHPEEPRDINEFIRTEALRVRTLGHTERW